MLPSHSTAYLDDEELQDRGTCKYAHMHTHTHTHTHVKAGYPTPQAIALAVYLDGEEARLYPAALPLT